MRCALANFGRWAGDVSLRKIDTAMLEKYQIERLKQVARATVDKELVHVCRMVRRVGFEVRKPAPKHGREKRIREFTPDEISRFFAVCPNRLKAVFLTQLATGARLEELVPSGRSRHEPLLKSELDLEERTITIRAAKRKPGQGEEVRRLPIPASLVPILKAQVKSVQGPYVFSKLHNSQPDFDSVLAKAEIPKSDELGRVLTARSSFRHTYATMQAENGATEFVLAHLLGHSQTRTTKWYTHVQVVGDEVPVDWERLTRGPARVFAITKVARKCSTDDKSM